MSKTGDVVFAHGQSWVKDSDDRQINRKWNGFADGTDYAETLKDLKTADDFRWLVKNGELVDGYNDGELVSLRTVRRVLDTQWFALEARCYQAAQAEREAIAAWLRSVDNNWSYPNAIESGFHLRDISPSSDHKKRMSCVQCGTPFGTFETVLNGRCEFCVRRSTKSDDAHERKPWENCCPSLYTIPEEDSTQGSTMSDEYVSDDYSNGQISDAYKNGREEERIAIVAWMRQRHTDLGQLAAKLCGRHPDGWLAGQVFFAGRTADAIEALELGEVTPSKHEKNMTDEDIVDLVEYTHKVQKAAAKSERTAIIKWLNNNERYFPDWWISGDYAQAIELGEYLQVDEDEIIGE